MGRAASDNDKLSCDPAHRDGAGPRAEAPRRPSGGPVAGADWRRRAAGCPGSHVVVRAGAHDLPIVPHTNVQQKLHSQLAAATPHCPMLENCYESIKDIWVEPIDVVDGHYQLPTAPGVGLELTEETLSRCTVATTSTV